MMIWKLQYSSEADYFFREMATSNPNFTVKPYDLIQIANETNLSDPEFRFNLSFMISKSQWMQVRCE